MKVTNMQGRTIQMFTSPSQATSIVLGRNANGWIEWKNVEGKTLDYLKRKSLN